MLGLTGAASQALQTGGAPKVTFVRRGPDEDNARPTIGHVLLVES